jgi:hypothetical protein
MPQEDFVMVWIVSSTMTLPVWLGVEALHPRLDRVSTFRLTGTHRTAVLQG